MAIPILKIWQNYFLKDRNEGLGSSYERVVLNVKLDEIRKRFHIHSALEVPVFGFTGLSGINSMWLAKNSVSVHLIDNDQKRLQWIEGVWNEVNLPADFRYQPTFDRLPFPDKAIDFAWNFSAMWFLDDMDAFLKELTRVVSKVIMICVPNRSGFGYLIQKYISNTDIRKRLREEFIIPQNIVKSLKPWGWKLIERNYIDCPPWPDIGMAKEDFLNIFGLGFLAPKNKSGVPFYSIMDFYTHKDREFAQKMLKYAWLENSAPKFLKYVWAHHRFLIFTPDV
jgi:hypothetical protein